MTITLNDTELIELLRLLNEVKDFTRSNSTYQSAREFIEKFSGNTGTSYTSQNLPDDVAY